VLDVTKARNEYGWGPSIAFEDGVRRLCAEALGT
jgi:nucleoside-diphosphate-sugar epimerase